MTYYVSIGIQPFLQLLHTEKMQGEQIVPAKGFEIKEEDQMYDITITGEDGKQYRTCVYRQSRE